MQANLAIFASGRGSNAEKIIQYFADNPEINISLIVASKKTAGVLDLAYNFQIPSLVLDRNSFYKDEIIVDELKVHGISHIILAGFLWKVPSYLIQAFENRIVNIHPALLPRYGGKGMYGHYVHEAVLKNKEDRSGITIHLVNEVYDDGRILFQTSCSLKGLNSPNEIAAKVLDLEHRYFPKVIELWIQNEMNL